MGYVRHHAIVVTSWSRELVEQAHTVAPSPVTPIAAGNVEQYWSFAVLPDGSKEGWPESDFGDRERAKFKSWLREQAYDDGSSSLEWVEVAFGYDDGLAAVSDSPFVEEEEEVS